MLQTKSASRIVALDEFDDLLGKGLEIDPIFKILPEFPFVDRVSLDRLGQIILELLAQH
jgi:hypothetical protein